MLTLVIACVSSEGHDSAPLPDTTTPTDPTCADAVSYTEVGGDWGLTGAPDPDEAIWDESSLAVADLDHDGDTDLLVSFSAFPDGLAPSGEARVYWNDGDWTPEALPGWVTTPTLAEIDGDGVLDLIAGTLQGPARIRGSGFTPLVATEGKAPRELAASDIDGDGAIDLYVLDGHGEGEGDYLLEGDGSGGFVPVDSGVPGDLTGRLTFDGQWFDWDGDADLDLYIVNDQRTGNVLLANEGGRLVDRSSECSCDLVHSGMGGHAGDVDGDGVFDLYITAASLSVLLKGTTEGTFYDVTAALDADPIATGAEMTWGAVFLDHDNDGLTDVFVSQGDFTGGEHGSIDRWPASLLVQEADGTFTDRGAQLGLPMAGLFRTTVATDINGDGVLDLVLGDVLDRPQVFLSDGCTQNTWIEVVAAPGSTVVVEADGRRWTSLATTESGFAAAQDPIVHVGLGTAGVVDRVTITTPDGSSEVIEGPVAVRQRI